jgi:hypothetical protein
MKQWTNTALESSALNVKTLAMLSVLFLTLTGCTTATVNDVVQSKDNGMARTYPIDKEKAWQISKSVLRWNFAGLFEEHQKDGYILAKIDLPGEFMFNPYSCTWVDPIDNNNTKVTFLIMGIGGTHALESRFHKDYLKAVDILDSGKPLPMERPQ